jgi:hypothetical protein
MKIADKLLELLRKRGSAWEDEEQDLRDVATRSGIADVDPEPLSQISGEGIDLERDVRAHNDIEEQRERMRRVPRR